MNIKELKTSFQCGIYTYRIPTHMLNGLEEYVNRGIPQGSFLNAVLSNDLKEAIRTADDLNMGNIPAYIYFLFNFAPIDCYGSKENVEKWIEKGGKHGR